MITKEYVFDREANAGLTLYLHEDCPEFQRVKNRPFVLIIPGGGYSFCSEREGEPIALNFLASGYHTGVLRYHVGQSRHFEQSLADAEKSLNIIRELAKEWKIDQEKIAVIGFSAGGHLAAAMSNLLEEKPSLCILGYPAILSSFSEVMKIAAPSLDQCVTKDTPPTFLFSTFEDNVVPIENSLLYLRALEENEVPFETHIFQKGLHGLSLASKWYGAREEMIDERFARWLPQCIEWMELNWKESEKVNHTIEISNVEEVPIKQLMAVQENQQLFYRLFPRWQDSSSYKIVKNFSVNQLRRAVPEMFSAKQLEQLSKGLVVPKEGNE